jgi:hypothetical protein
MQLNEALKMVRDMTGVDDALEPVEHFIESLPLDEEERSVLWLYAWVGGQASEVRSILLAG